MWFFFAFMLFLLSMSMSVNRLFSIRISVFSKVVFLNSCFFVVSIVLQQVPSFSSIIFSFYCRCFYLFLKLGKHSGKQVKVSILFLFSYFQILFLALTPPFTSSLPCPRAYSFPPRDGPRRMVVYGRGWTGAQGSPRQRQIVANFTSGGRGDVRPYPSHMHSLIPFNIFFYSLHIRISYLKLTYQTALVYYRGVSFPFSFFLPLYFIIFHYFAPYCVLFPSGNFPFLNCMGGSGVWGLEQ